MGGGGVGCGCFVPSIHTVQLQWPHCALKRVAMKLSCFPLCLFMHVSLCQCQARVIPNGFFYKNLKRKLLFTCIPYSQNNFGMS